MKNVLEGINNILWCRTHKQTRRQNTGYHPIKAAKRKKKVKSSEDSLRDFWHIKPSNIHVTGIPEGEEREKEVENVFDEITAEDFPNLKQETVIQVQEEQSPRQDESKETHTKTYNN